jgi:hypothetical protein
MTRRLCALCVGLALWAGGPAGAAPSPTPLPAGDLTKFRALAPKQAQHTEFVVEVNGKGQVSRVRSGKHSHDKQFDTVTYGNALQTFIRTPEDKSIPGVYLLSYDYDPKTLLVHRSVQQIRAGGVNAAAPGIVTVFAEMNRRSAAKLKKALEHIPVPTAMPAKVPKPAKSPV